MLTTDNIQKEVLDKELKEAASMVEAFKIEFYKRFKVYPNIVYNMNIKGLVGIDLATLVKIIDSCMFDTYKYSDDTRNFTRMMKTVIGIRNPTRLRHVVIHRQIYYKIAYELGYSYSVIGRQLSKNHATVIHGIKHLDTMIEVKDKLTLALVDHVLETIKAYLNDNQFNPDNSEVQDKPRSDIRPVLHSNESGPILCEYCKRDTSLKIDGLPGQGDETHRESKSSPGGNSRDKRKKASIKKAKSNGILIRQSQ